jgi:hypothetical protein
MEGGGGVRRKHKPVPPKAVKVWLAYHKASGELDRPWAGPLPIYVSRKHAREHVTNPDYGYCQYRLTPIRARKKKGNPR